ncbi:MAG TPA: hypothetical protein VNZ53_51025, partial [Steroidobacteraceae bacterium]|nr:hypothetical protein [Steroidobacteraceae bacterium]
MARSIVALSVAIAASIVASGCAYLSNHWPHHLNFASAPRQYRPHRMVTHESSGGNGETTTPVSEGSPSPPTGQGSPVGPGAQTVTIGSDENDRTEAERLLNYSDARLARVDRAHLSGEDASNYRQAAEFARSAH